MKMIKKMRMVLLIVLTTSLVFTGCSGSGEKSPSANLGEKKSEKKEVTLSFLSWQNETIMGPIIEAFNKENPDIKIDLQFAPPVQDYIEKFQILSSTGELPDIFVTAAENKTQVFENDMALDLSALPVFKRLGSANLNTYTQDGKTVAFAPDAWIAGVFYNKRMFRDFDIKVPTNREEYLLAMKTLNDKGIQPWGFSSTNLYDPIQGYVATETIAKNKDYDKEVDEGKLTYDEGWSEALRLWDEDYVKPGYVKEDSLGLTGDLVNELFAFEEVGMMVGATWVTSAIEELNPDLEYGMLPWFGKDDAWMVGAAGVGWSINAQTKHPEEAMKFLEFLSSDEALIIFQENTGGLLAVSGIDFEIHPVIEEGYQYLLDGKFYLPAVSWKHSDALGKEVLVGTQEVIGNNLDPQQISKNMDAKWSELEK